ncbi:hypothetical protein [Caulobacter sp. 1776]|uniref:hypothetical protein n=1 Tax=Caulobacter sp. 1776 TaxID=3156420 RepID=UPI0033979A94
MIDPLRLLVIADDLAGRTKKGAPNQTLLRRSVSTAYYALFHHLLQAGTDALVGKRSRKSARYALIYRSFEHARMKQICQAVDKPVLADKEKIALGVAALRQELRDVANIFVQLQQQRHWADYSPHGKITRSDALDLVNQAELAIRQLDACPIEERRNFLALVMTSSR